MATVSKFYSKGKSNQKNEQCLRDKIGDHSPIECNHRLHKVFIHTKKDHATDGKLKVDIMGNEGIRTAIVPDRNPIDLPGIWQKSVYDRLTNQARITTLADKQAMIEEAEKKKNEQIYASEQRKALLQKMQFKREPIIGGKLHNIENDAKNKSEYLLQRSKELINEQDDKVKAINGLILATKCRAVRNAQIVEKEVIKKQLHEESRRLDTMMEQERQRLLKKDEQAAELEENKNKRYGQEIKQQIKENELVKLMDAERVEEESRMINKALIAMRKEEEEKVKEQKIVQKQIREDLHQANLDLERYKLIQKEEQRIADLRVQEFMNEKAAREEAREAEQNMIKAQKEKEINRLRQLQQKAQDKQAILDDMNAFRVQEEVERIWRAKEKEAALKRAQEIKELHEGRAKQIDDIRRGQAIEIARDEAAFHKVAKVQAEDFERDLAKLENKKAANSDHRKNLLKQINEKERTRINQMKEKYDEGKASRLSQAMRDDQINHYLQKKMQKLRRDNIPETYINDIERQIRK